MYAPPKKKKKKKFPICGTGITHVQYIQKVWIFMFIKKKNKYIYIKEKKKKKTHTQSKVVCWPVLIMLGCLSFFIFLVNSLDAYQFITAAIYYGHGYIKIQSINQFLPNN